MGVDSRAEEEYGLISAKVDEELKKAFRPEFLNRVDASIVFRPLSQEEMRRIVDLLVKRIISQLRDQGHALTITDAAKDHLIKVGYDVRRMVRDHCAVQSRRLLRIRSLSDSCAAKIRLMLHMSLTSSATHLPSCCTKRGAPSPPPCRLSRSAPQTESGRRPDGEE